MTLPWEGRVQGVDVSDAQSALDWRAMVAAGCKFAIVKATEGAAYVDRMCGAHHIGAQSAGLHGGTYHFFHSDIDGVVQAQNYARRIKTLTGLLPVMRPCIDWEDTHRVAAVGAQRALTNALAFLATIRDEMGARPMIYTMPSHIAALRGVDLSPLLGFDLLIAHYRWDPATGRDYGLTAPTIPAPWKEAAIWQAGGNGAPHIAGINVDIDRDVFLLGDEQAFLDWCADKPKREPQPTQPDTAPNDPYTVDRAEGDAEPDPKT